MEQELLNLINELRSHEGRPALTINADLSQACLVHSQGMEAEGSLDHNYPESFTVRAAGAGFPNVACAENLAMATSAITAYTMWIKSPPHRQNMVGDFNLCGLAVSGGYWTLLLVKA